MKPGDRLYTEAEMQALREQLEAARSALQQIADGTYYPYKIASDALAQWSERATSAAVDDPAEHCGETVGERQGRQPAPAPSPANDAMTQSLRHDNSGAEIAQSFSREYGLDTGGPRASSPANRPEQVSAVSTETDLPSAGTKRADLPEPTLGDFLATSPPTDPLGYIELDDKHRCPHGVHKGLGCRVCDPASASDLPATSTQSEGSAEGNGAESGAEESSPATESVVASGADMSGPSGEPGTDSVPYSERASELDVPAAEAGWTGAPDPASRQDA